MKSCIGLFYQISVTDKNGKVVRKTRLRRSRSFCIAFLQVLQALMSQTDVSVKDSANTARAISPHSTDFQCNAVLSEETKGILLGTGTTPPANTDYNLETLIAEGGGAGEMNYAAASFIAAQVIGANVDLQILRSAQNLSGNTINVTEAGMLVVMDTNYRGLILHDVFTAVPVANGETITATYTLRTTV